VNLHFMAINEADEREAEFIGVDIGFPASGVAKAIDASGTGYGDIPGAGGGDEGGLARFAIRIPGGIIDGLEDSAMPEVQFHIGTKDKAGALPSSRRNLNTPAAAFMDPVDGRLDGRGVVIRANVFNDHGCMWCFNPAMVRTRARTGGRGRR